MPTMKLSYFDIEGAAEQVRLTLILAGVDFEDHRIKFPEWPEFKKTTPYGQVPVLTVGGDSSEMKTQSGAMIRWIAVEHGKSKNLYPLDQIYQVEEALGVIGDMQKSVGPALYMGMSPEKFGHPTGYSKTDEGKDKIASMRKEWIANELPKFLGYIGDMIDKVGDGKWIATSDGPSIADCVAVAHLRSYTKGHMDHVPKDCLDSHPKIVEYIQRFCALPEIQGRYTDGVH